MIYIPMNHEINNEITSTRIIDDNVKRCFGPSSSNPMLPPVASHFLEILKGGYLR